MLKKDEVVQISAYKSCKKVGDTVEICEGNDPGIVNLGTVLEVIAAGGIVIAILVKILA